MDGEIVSTEPATGAVVWRGWSGDVEAEVAAARAAWAGWAARPLTFRIETLRRFANAVRAKIEALTELIAREAGRPLWDARGEAESVVARVEASIGGFGERTAQRKLEGALNTRVAVRHKPHGVLGVITPAAMPAQVPADHIVPALIAGNAVVLKPSSKVPAVGRMIVELMHEAGVPEGALRLLIGGAAEGQALARHPQIDGVLFAGSAATGMALHRAFAETPHRLLALSLGGNNPLVVWQTRDIAAAAAMVVNSSFLSSGQRPTAARRLIVHDGAHEPLIDEITKLAGRLIVGEPHDKPAPFMGPVIDGESADGLQERFLDLILNGGRAIKHLERPAPDRPFLSPAIIDVTGVAGRPDQELFGPILQVIRVPSFEAAIAEANATRYGLAAGLIGGSPELYDRFWATARAGVVNWNQSLNSLAARAPFGGTGLSGNFRPGGFYAADRAAYPVVSSEADQPRAFIGVGVRDATNG